MKNMKRLMASLIMLLLCTLNSVFPSKQIERKSKEIVSATFGPVPGISPLDCAKREDAHIKAPVDLSAPFFASGAIVSSALIAPYLLGSYKNKTDVAPCYVKGLFVTYDDGSLTFTKDGDRYDTAESIDVNIKPASIIGAMYGANCVTCLNVTDVVKNNLGKATATSKLFGRDPHQGVAKSTTLKYLDANGKQHVSSIPEGHQLKLPKGGVTVISASYGTCDQCLNVTETIKANLNKEVTLGVPFFGSDPAPNMPKTTVILYKDRQQGNQRRSDIEENKRIFLTFSALEASTVQECRDYRDCPSGLGWFPCEGGMCVYCVSTKHCLDTAKTKGHVNYLDYCDEGTCIELNT